MGRIALVLATLAVLAPRSGHGESAGLQRLRAKYPTIRFFDATASDQATIDAFDRSKGLVALWPIGDEIAGLIDEGLGFVPEPARGAITGIAVARLADLGDLGFTNINTGKVVLAIDPARLPRPGGSFAVIARSARRRWVGGSMSLRDVVMLNAAH